MALLLLFVGLAACTQQKSEGPPILSQCLGITIPSSTEVTMIGVYQGDRGDTPETFPVSDRPALRIKLSSSWRTQPQVVVLSGEEPIIWDFADVSPDKVVGVIAYGYDRQAIENLPPTIPYKNVSYADSKTNSPGCGDFFTVDEGGPELDLAVAQVEEVTGLKVTRFHGANTAKEMSLDGDGQWPVAPREKWELKSDTRPGDGLIAALVADDTLRPATQDDVDAWNQRAMQDLKTAHLAAYAAEHLEPYATYVVLKPLPPHNDVLFRTFIVPANLEIAPGKGDHNDFYYMRDGTCRGSPGYCLAADGRPRPRPPR